MSPALRDRHLETGHAITYGYTRYTSARFPAELWLRRAERPAQPHDRHAPGGSLPQTGKRAARLHAAGNAPTTLAATGRAGLAGRASGAGGAAPLRWARKNTQHGTHRRCVVSAATNTRGGLPPPPSNINEALRRIPGKSRRSALRRAFHVKYNLTVFSGLTGVGKRAVYAGLAFCWDAIAVEDLIQEEVMRDLDPRRAAQCARVARGRGLEYDHTNPVHRARVACGWVRRQHSARARSGARE